MTGRWRYWLLAATNLGVVAFLAVIAVPCENLRIVVKNDSRERAAIRVVVRDHAASARIVWTGTAGAGETREIPLHAPPGHHLLHVVAQFPDRSEPKVIEDRTFIRGSLFGGRTYNFRFVDENLQSGKNPPELSVPFESDIDSFLSAFGHIAKVLYGVMRCEDFKLRQGFRRWVADSPFRSKSGGQSG